MAWIQGIRWCPALTRIDLRQWRRLRPLWHFLRSAGWHPPGMDSLYEHLLPQLRHPLLNGLRSEISCSNQSRVWTGHQTGHRVLPDWCILAVRTMRLLVEMEDPVEVEPGNVLAIPPFVPHNIRVTSGPGTSTWIHGRWLTAEGDDLLVVTGQPMVLRGPAARLVAEAINDLVRHLATEDLSAKALAEGQIAIWRMVAALMARPGPASTPLARLLVDRRLSPVVVFARQHLAQPLTCAGLAQVAGLKPSRFHQLFRDQFGQSPASWVRRERIAQAQRLLQTTQLPVAQIAAHTGPWDVTTFHRAFINLTGHSPAAWRRFQMAMG